jgi:hypothetical protein
MGLPESYYASLTEISTNPCSKATLFIKDMRNSTTVNTVKLTNFVNLSL